MQLQALSERWLCLLLQFQLQEFIAQEQHRSDTQSPTMKKYQQALTKYNLISNHPEYQALTLLIQCSPTLGIHKPQVSPPFFLFGKKAQVQTARADLAVLSVGIHPFNYTISYETSDCRANGLAGNEKLPRTSVACHRPYRLPAQCLHLAHLQRDSSTRCQHSQELCSDLLRTQHLDLGKNSIMGLARCLM